MKHKLKAFRWTFFHFSPQGVRDRELRPSPAFHAVFFDGVQTKQWGRPSKVLRARALRAELRCARVTSMPRVRAHTTPNARARLVRMHLCLTHTPSGCALPPQARTSLRLPAGLRRRLARASARPRARAAGWPEAGRGQRARAAGLHREEYCSSRVPSTSTISSRIRLDKAGRKRSGYRTLRARSLNHSAAIRSTAGPSPAGHSGGSGGRQPPG